MNNNRLPTWAVYLIAGLGAATMLMSGVAGTLLNNDRASVNKTLDRFEIILERQAMTIKKVSDHNDKQNHILDKMCWLMTFDHKTRMNLMRNYPVLTPEKPKP